MSRLPINTFSPIDTEQKLEQLCSYVLSLKPKDNYGLEDILKIIRTRNLKKIFLDFAAQHTEIFDEKSVLFKKNTLNNDVQLSNRINIVEIKPGNKSDTKHKPRLKKTKITEPQRPLNHNGEVPVSKGTTGNESSTTLINSKHIVKFIAEFNFNPAIFISWKTVKSQVISLLSQLEPSYRRIRKDVLRLIKEKWDSTYSINNKTNSSIKVPNSPAKTNTIYSTIPSLEQNYLSCDLTIAEEIPAIEFVIKEGQIQYHDFILKSVKIHETPISILERINIMFTIRKDVHFTGETKRFMFNPPTDFSLLLAEIERLKDSNIQRTYDEFPLNGTFELPWDHVRFYDGVMYLLHPNPSIRGTMSPFHFIDCDISRSFRDILPYIESRCEPFIVESFDGCITKLSNYDSFRKMIPYFKELISAELDDYAQNVLKNKNTKTYYTKSEFAKTTYTKSKFLSFLSTLQLTNRKILRITEGRFHSSSVNYDEESGFLFTISQDEHSILAVFENESEDSRSSLVFEINPPFYNQGILVIKNFLSSDMQNKRQRLACKTLVFKDISIISYHRIAHTGFEQWKNNIISLYSNNA